MRNNTVMSSIFLILGLFAFQALCANNTTTATTTNTNATTPKAQCALIYTAANQTGNSSQICKTGNVPAAFNKSISSILVPAGYNMRLFKQAREKGEWLDIPPGLWNAPADWKNSVASVYLNHWTACASFFSAANETGTSIKVCDGGVLVPGYNDKVASVSIPSTQSYRLFKNNNFTGDWVDVIKKSNLPADFVNKVGSMRLQFTSKCATTYTGQNKTGTPFVICQSSNYLPTGEDKAINSIVVPKNLTLIVYQNANYTGASLKIMSGTWNAPANWTNTISSIKISAS